MEEKGVWRTISGRKVFIKDGQSLNDAMQESGKFNGGSVQRQDTTPKTTQLNNKQNVINYVKEQLNIDMTEYLEPATAKSRTYLGVHLEDMPINDRNAILRTLKQDKRMTIMDNGGYGSAIVYKK